MNFRRKKKVSVGKFEKALAADDTKALEKLLSDGFDPMQIISHIGETPFTLAALNGRARIIEVLKTKAKNQNVDVNYHTNNGWTALMFAARDHTWVAGEHETPNQVETVKMLLKLGTNKLLKNNDGDTALTLATKGKNLETLKLLQ